MSRKIILIALLASACAAFAFDRDHLIHAAPSCPSSWPQTLPISSPLVSFPLYQHDGFYTDTNGPELVHYHRNRQQSLYNSPSLPCG